MTEKTLNGHIYVYDFIDYMEGKKEEDIFQQYKSHIETCEICIESLQYFIQKRKNSPFENPTIIDKWNLRNR